MFSKVKFYYSVIVSVIYLAKNRVNHARIKHINVRFHKIRKLVSFDELLFGKTFYYKQVQVLLELD